MKNISLNPKIIFFDKIKFKSLQNVTAAINWSLHLSNLCNLESIYKMAR